MSGNHQYDPDQAALDTLAEPWSESLRTQRDLGLLVPINFHVVPSISLRAACFKNNLYSDRAVQKCFSNLLALGLRRFTVDVYWDQTGSQWSLCPAEIAPPGSDSDSNPSSTSTTTPSSASASAPDSTSPASPSSFSGSRSVTLTARGTTTRLPSQVASFTAAVVPRQASSVASSSISASSTASVIGSQPLSSTEGNGLKPYNCTGSLTLSYLTNILSNFLDKTSTTTDATIVFLLLNIHATAPWSSPTSPAQQPTQLPSPGNFISDVINGNLSASLYTPQKLEAQRADLDGNEGWLSGGSDDQPASGYYETYQGNGQLSTSDGWPTEAFLVFRRVERLIVSFNSIDPQMSDYNLTVDESTIFPVDTIRQLRPTAFGPDGTVSSGCLFVSSESSITESTNSSWAVALASDINIGANSDFQSQIPSVGNLTSCGLSAFLNTTLANTTAEQNPLPYAAFLRSSMWTFTPGEPSNSTVGSDTTGRCAAMLIDGSYPGRWRTVDCATRLRAACQNTSVPYHWEISSERGSYGNVQSLCPPGLKFSVPHTPLENSHLYAAALASSSTSQSREPILVNLNSLNVEDCWVSGENTTCPYLPPTDNDRVRVVVVPTVAAVIIFVCAALTFFVKCAANRREDKRGRRRRMVGGWEYEGVPS